MKVQAATNPVAYGLDPKTSKGLEEKLEAKTSAKMAQNDKIGRPNEDRVNVSSGAEKPVTYERPKQMTSAQLDDIRSAMDNRNAQFLQSMMAANFKNQAAAAGGMDFATSAIFTQSVGQLQMPQIAQTKESAQAAIGKGGEYSVDAVATRIMDMAEKLAGGDSTKLTALRKAVEKGFKAAGVDFERASGKKMPSITKDTYNEISKRFDALEEKLNTKPGTKPGVDTTKPETKPKHEYYDTVERTK